MNPTTPVGADPLAQLRGLHLPAAIGPWPPAPGWWMPAAVVVMLLATAAARVGGTPCAALARAGGEANESGAGDEGNEEAV